MRTATTMGELDELVTADEGRLLRAWRGGEWVEPMLATLTSRPFSSDDWLYERKLDGVRVVAGRDGGRPMLWSRRRNRVDTAYPEIVEALEGEGDRFLVDGEVVAFEGEQTSFGLLQRRMHLSNARQARATGVPIVYYLFDIMAFGGVDLTWLPLLTRKRLLREFFGFSEPLRYSEHCQGAGQEYLRSACERGWEGLIAKRADADYRSGRSRDWLKLKCVAGQEFVVGGFTEPKGARTGFGALLIGYYEDAHLRYAGKVGTGYDERTLRLLHDRLRAAIQDESPFADRVPLREVHWVRPELVAEIGFSEWTGDGRLRHPRFIGLREDKPASSVIRER